MKADERDHLTWDCTNCRSCDGEVSVATIDCRHHGSKFGLPFSCSHWEPKPRTEREQARDTIEEMLGHIDRYAEPLEQAAQSSILGLGAAIRAVLDYIDEEPEERK